MCAFSAIRRFLGLSLAAMNSPHAVQCDCIRGDIPRKVRRSKRGLGDFDGMMGYSCGFYPRSVHPIDSGIEVYARAMQSARLRGV